MTAAKIRHGEPRFDALRPSVFDPADFEVVDYLDLEEWKDQPAYGSDIADWEKTIVAWFGDRGRDFVEERSPNENPLWVCDHCGYPQLRYVGVVRQKSTGDVYVFGSSCVARAALEDREEWKLVQLTSAAANRRERARLAEKAAHYLNDNEDLRAFLLSIERGEDGEPTDSFDFVNSLDRALTKYGELTEKQAAGLRKVIAKREEIASRPEPEPEPEAGPAPEGKQLVEGEVVALKYVEGYYPNQSVGKIVVKLENGSRVWVTLPSFVEIAFDRAIRDENEHTADGLVGWMRGKKLRFSATFEVSRKDPTFAFGKRPTKVEILEEATK